MTMMLRNFPLKAEKKTTTKARKNNDKNKRI